MLSLELSQGAELVQLSPNLKANHCSTNAKSTSSDLTHPNRAGRRQCALMLTEQVCHTEYLALEQALAAADQSVTSKPGNYQPDRLLADQLVPAGWRQHITPASVFGIANPTSSSISGAGSKRKLPSSFAQTEQPSPAGPAKELHYQILSQPPQAVGFDIEWRVTYKAGEALRKTALLQLCSKDPHGSYKCWLLHIARSGMTPSLLKLLQNEAVQKIGVGISGDAHKLQRDFGTQCAGLICLSDEANARLCNGSNGRMPQTWSLAGLTEELLHMALDKRSDIRCSNWEQCPLSAAQQAYAATDAYAALKLYQVLQGMPILAPLPRPEAPALAPALHSALESANPTLHIPAATELLPLQPSKLNAYKLFIEQGMTMEAIAVQRAVQLGTVQSYVAEAMAAGYPYPWHRLGVPHALLATFCAHLTAFQNYQNEVREQQQQEQLQPRNPQVHVVAQGLSHTVMDQQQVHSYGLPQQQSQPRALPQQQTAAQQSTPLIAAAEAPLHQQPAQLPGQVQVVQHAGSLLQQTHGPQTYDVKYKWQQRQMPQHWSQTAARHAVASAKAADPQGARSGIGTAQSIVQEEAALAGNQQDVQPQLWLQLDGTLTCQPHKLHVHETGAEHTGQHVVQLPVRGLVEEMVKTGQGIKALRDYIGPDAMSYGQMRIALAHLYRLALYPSARPGTFSPVHHIEGLFSVVS